MGVVFASLSKKLLSRLPKRALSNLELMQYAKRLKLPNFRGVFMRDELKRMKPWKSEMAVVNLDTMSGEGTHWVSYSKVGNKVTFFDSYGLRPPPEIARYFKGSPISYSNEIKQNYDTSNCGQLCLQFLIKEAALNRGEILSS